MAYSKKTYEAAARMGGFYRSNPHRFAQDFLHLDLKLFQKILLVMMDYCTNFCYIAARGQGKSWLIAVFCCIRCILYPGTKICISSGKRSQSIEILEKIRSELIPKSDLLDNEIKALTITTQKAEVLFRGGSFIKVVTASDTARGNRANILILDEFRMIPLDTVETVLRNFLTARRTPGYLKKPEYAHLQEPNKEVYLSSAYFKSHWSYKKVKSFCKNMLDDKRKYFVCGLPYQLSIKEDIMDAQAVEDKMSESSFNEVTWSMENECLWFGDNEGGFFSYDSIDSNRKIQFPWLPPSKYGVPIDKRLQIPPKKNGEIRIISADIALMSSTKKVKNDATAIVITSSMPNTMGKFCTNVMYTTVAEGKHTQDQAIMIRRLYEDFDCDYIAIDAQGVGMGVYDTLARDLYDSDLGITYPALSCYNNDEMAARCPREAKRVIWSIKASADLNSDCAYLLREGFASNRIRLLVNEYDADKYMSAFKGYEKLSPEEKDELRKPYLDTTLLIKEIINLQAEAKDNNRIKVKEKSGMRKDRYSSLSYNYWVVSQIEAEERYKLRQHSAIDMDGLFMFRAPKIR